MRTFALPFVLTLVAACSPSGTSTPRTEVEGGREEVTYLRGVESEYSMRLEDLSSEELLGSDTAMREALIAGDGDYYVAAALFRHDDYLTLDLIVLNHSADDLQIERSDLRLVDERGQWLTPVEDFDGAYRYGLRGKRANTSVAAFFDAPTSGLSKESVISPDVMEGTGSSQWKSRTRSEIPRTRRPVGDDTTWRGATDPVQRSPNAPDVLTVGSREGRAYWGYWRAEGLSPPLTAFVMLEDRHLIFRFDR